MKKISIVLILVCTVVFSIAFRKSPTAEAYTTLYENRVYAFENACNQAIKIVQTNDIADSAFKYKVLETLNLARNDMKAMDFWTRYLEPNQYKKINGPLPIEWETEVHEKWEKPYKRIGGGMTLAYNYLQEDSISKDTLLNLLSSAMQAVNTYKADSVTKFLDTYHHFYLCNRLYLLNLATIYTTGFENPNTKTIIPELLALLQSTNKIYEAYNQSFESTALSPEYLSLYSQAILFVKNKEKDYTTFDHFTFIKNYVNPLFSLNQALILKHKVVSKSLVDYTLNKNATSIFDKNLYSAQNPKGVFLRVKDESILAEIKALGKQLFFDPILSGNNLRSCASCHKPNQFFVDTNSQTALQFNHTEFLPRNTPTLINAQYNHLTMTDGQHISLLNQTKGVITHVLEMNSTEGEVLKKIQACKTYKLAFSKLLALTPQAPDLSLEHVSSAITLYYGSFSQYYSPFDNAMNHEAPLESSAKRGYNIFMGKAQCGTCHFAPIFNGVKPPFTGSEFEVLGVPADTSYIALSADIGRYGVFEAEETKNAFRTNTLRNSARTAPYMHNGVFQNMNQVIDFYNKGGGVGHGLNVKNQTLSAEPLNLTNTEKTDLIAFINALTESIPFQEIPVSLPKANTSALKTRKVGGLY